MLKIAGDKQLPCLTPLPTENTLDSEPFHLTTQNILLFQSQLPNAMYSTAVCLISFCDAVVAASCVRAVGDNVLDQSTNDV